MGLLGVAAYVAHAVLAVFFAETGRTSAFIIGELVYIHLQDSILSDGLPDNRKIAHLARLGEEYYTAVAAEGLLAIPRPSTP